MNKQEAIEKIKNDNSLTGGLVEKSWAIYCIKQIDEPQKPVVSKFVANWYEENKDDFEYNVQCLCVHNCEPLREIDTWFDSDDTKPVETLVMMHKFGYEIEKEKLYIVEIPNPNRTSFPYTLYRKDDGKIIIIGAGDDYEKREEYQLTESEIKQDFEWAFQFAKPVEE